VTRTAPIIPDDAIPFATVANAVEQFSNDRIMPVLAPPASGRRSAPLLAAGIPRTFEPTLRSVF